MQRSSGCIRPVHDAPSNFISYGTWRFIPGALTGLWVANYSFRESVVRLRSANAHRLHSPNLFDESQTDIAETDEMSRGDPDFRDTVVTIHDRS